MIRTAVFFIVLSLASSAGARCEEVAPLLEAPFVEALPPLEDPLSSAWDAASPVSVKLAPQKVMIPWGASPESVVEVRALHDGDAIQVRMTWEDPTPDRSVKTPAQFSDGCGIMFPLAEANPQSLMMGLMGKVHVWHWKAQWDSADKSADGSDDASAETYADFHIPYEEGTVLDRNKYGKPRTESGPTGNVEEITAAGPANLERSPEPRARGKGIWRSSRWTVVFTRSLKAADGSVDYFEADRDAKAAFAVWNGSAKERGGRKSISNWISFRVKGR